MIARGAYRPADANFWPLGGPHRLSPDPLSRIRCNSAGENLALGHTSAGIVVADWMNSPTHRENILSDDYLEMGIGLREDSVDARHYWVQLFVGERVDGCLNELEFLDAPPTPSRGKKIPERKIIGVTTIVKW